MPYITLDMNLCQSLKDLRKSNNLSGKQLSALLNKSPAYISKLETNAIKKIEVDDLLDIFKCIFSDDKETFRIKFDEFIKNCEFKRSKKDIEQADWQRNFDTVIRIIPIVGDLPEFIISELNRLDKSVSDVVNRANINEDLDEKKKRLLLKLPSNFWHTLFVDTKDECTSIIIDLSVSEIEDILKGKVQESNFITLQAFLYNLYKYEFPNDFEKAYKKAENELFNHQFFTIEEKFRRKKENKDAESNTILTEHDKKNIKLGNDIIHGFQTASQFNIKYANEHMQMICNNMHSDLMFSIAYFSLDTSKLSSLSKDDKTKFLQDVKRLIDKYASADKQLEIFDV